MLVIGLCGAEGAGKSTVAQVLEQYYGATVLPFAAPFKRMLAEIGVPDAHLYGTPEQKAQPLELLAGHSARYAMQTLGTEWGRECMGPDFWATIWRAKVQKIVASYDGRKHPIVVVADDVRFGSEVSAIRDYGGTVLCVVSDPVSHKRELRKQRAWFGSLQRRAYSALGLKPHASTQYASLQYDAELLNIRPRWQVGADVAGIASQLEAAVPLLHKRRQFPAA